jgi:hypothetical protein
MFMTRVSMEGANRRNALSSPVSILNILNPGQSQQLNAPELPR